jgi:serine/threonine protein kinase
MMAILGPPPKDILQSEYATRFYNDQGNWTNTNEIPTTPLDRLEANLQGDKQALFHCFMRKMHQWRPEDRASAKELLSDPWLRTP